MNDGVVFTLDEWKQSKGWMFPTINSFHDFETAEYLMSKMNVNHRQSKELAACPGQKSGRTMNLLSNKIKFI